MSFLTVHCVHFSHCVIVSTSFIDKVNLVQDDEQTIDSLFQFIKENIHNDSKIVTKQAKTIHINLPREVSLQKIFSTLYSDGAASEGKQSFLLILHMIINLPRNVSRTNLPSIIIFHSYQKV